MATKLRNLKINRVAHVDKGAGQGVEIILSKRMEVLPDEVEAYLKRDFTADERKTLADKGDAMPGGGFPIESRADLDNAIRAIGRAKDPAATKKHIIARAKALGASDKIPSDWTGVGKKLTITHGKDGTVTFVHEPEPGEKTIGKRERLEDALELLSIAKAADDGESLVLDADNRNERIAKLHDAIDALGTSIASIYDDAEVTAVEKVALLCDSLNEFTTYTQDLVAQPVGKATPSATGGLAPMSAELKKALGLPDTATDAEMVAAVTKAQADAKTAAEELTKANALAEAVMKMSDKHAAFMNKDGATMPKGGKSAFAAMTPAERDAHIASCADDSPEGMEKRAIAALPESVRKSLADGAAAMIEVTKLREAGELATFTKRLEPLKTIGEPVEKAKMIQAISKSDPAAAEALLKEFERLDGVVTKAAEGGLLNEHGSGQRQGIGKARDGINAQAAQLLEKERAAGRKMTIEKARDLVRQTNPDLAEQERVENSSRRAA